jgi:hypothetical protein
MLISSCHETKEFQFNIINLTNIEEIIVKFKINLGRNSKEIEIDLKNKNKLTLKKDDFLIGYTSGGYGLFFYPSIFSLENGGTVDIFVYDNPWVEKEEKTYKISPCENVNSYFLYLIIEDDIIQIISDNPVISMEKFDNSDIDIIYVNDPPEILLNELTDKEFIGGYIVRSNIDNSLLFLR